MREAARALDEVSDHLGELLRRADGLLAEWATFGGEVRAQVEREAAAVGAVVEGAVGRAAAQGIDRAIGDRLRALTVELDRLEQRTRAVARAAVEQREGDRRILWAVVAGIVLANGLLVVVLLRGPETAPAAEPIRLESTSAPRPPADPPRATLPEVGSADAGSAVPAQRSASPAATVGSNAPAPGASAPRSGQGGGERSGGQRGRDQLGPTAAPSAATKSASGSGADRQIETVAPRPISPPPKSGTARPHKKLP